MRHKNKHRKHSGPQIAARVMVATPTYTGDVVHECAMAMQIATVHCLMRGVALDWVFAAGCSLVQLARDWLHAEFLERKECTHLLWLDADLSFMPDVIMRMLCRNLDVVAGVYTTKSPTNPVFPYEGLGPVVNGLQQARKIPGGFILVKRHVAQAVAESCETYELNHNEQTRESAHIFEVPLIESEKDPSKKVMLGEDYVYCHHLQTLGFKIAVETDIGFAHIGRHAWHANLAKTLKDEAERGFSGQGSTAAHQINTDRQQSAAA